MPRSRKKETPDINGMSTRQLKKRKPINTQYLKPIEPMTDNQQIMFEEWGKGKNIYAGGCAGTGKTFCALFLALQSVLDEDSEYDKVYIVRSLVSTREIGFLPGTHADKADIYQIPYKNMVKHIFGMSNDLEYDLLYEKLKAQETISFWSTSFIRGTTLDNAIVIVDECQNLNFHELDSIITRCGQDTRIIFCGDARQSDLQKKDEKSGILDFRQILTRLEEEFSIIEFDIEDIVRSGLVRKYLMAKINAGL
jgi:predicted ribonuclease YlaK